MYKNTENISKIIAARLQKLCDIAFEYQNNLQEVLRQKKEIVFESPLDPSLSASK